MHVVSSASQLFLEFFLETVFVPVNNSQSSCLSRTLLWVTPSETSVETEDVEKPPATKLNLMIIPQRVVRRNKTWNVCELCDPWHAVQQLNSTCFGPKTRIWTMGSCRVHWYGIYAAQWFYACLFPWKKRLSEWKFSQKHPPNPWCNKTPHRKHIYRCQDWPL